MGTGMPTGMELVMETGMATSSHPFLLSKQIQAGLYDLPELFKPEKIRVRLTQLKAN